MGEDIIYGDHLVAILKTIMLMFLLYKNAIMFLLISDFRFQVQDKHSFSSMKMEQGFKLFNINAIELAYLNRWTVWGELVFCKYLVIIK